MDWGSLPIQRPPRLILRHPRLKEILLLLEIDKFGHPRERIGRTGIQHLQPDLLRPPIGHKPQILLEHRRIQPQQIGLDVLYPGATNPFPWMSELIDLKKEKNFFETRVTEYQTGGALNWE